MSRIRAIGKKNRVVTPFPRIRYFAKARGLSYAEIAERLCEMRGDARPRRATLYELENGKQSANDSTDMLCAIASIFGVEPWHLYDTAPWPETMPDTRPPDLDQQAA